MLHLAEKKILGKHGFVVGIDEVGRGPLAGPVVSSAVVLDEKALKNEKWAEVRDSKTLNDKQRRDLVIFIQQNAVEVGIGMATAKEVDQLNVLQASLLSMKRAVHNLEFSPKHVFVDGKYEIPEVEYEQKAFIKGDSKLVSIAAASIVAKVLRDDLMLRFEKDYPEFQFGKHKGYPTDFHRKILFELGPTPIHRKSFVTVKQALKEKAS